MARFPQDFLTRNEQNALLLVCGLAILGIFLSQLGGEIPLLRTELDEPAQLIAAVSEDKPVQIDVRTASHEELMLLPGIGPKRAQDIIDFRQTQPFTKTEDLLLIKGIGPKTLAKMLPFLLHFGDSQLSNLLGDGKSSLQTDVATFIEQVTTPPQPAKTSKPPSVPKTELTNIVNINSAGLEELCTLPGIGEVKAQAIVDFRTQNGPFTAIEDITKVKGIGPKTLEKIRHRLSVGE
ncbi:MAG: ComEA family DNA-binding protein [Candidatus Syntrophosphaera sp.]|nr:ComEA family DNA-binding protein [Candidatus Syntrophosphaera sp.]